MTGVREEVGYIDALAYKTKSRQFLSPVGMFHPYL